ncbi:hypothetical protein MN608_02235 [Microdochium nivale]|nr:hypothetical protein MN608_02235 [Microdochium nivale]
MTATLLGPKFSFLPETWRAWGFSVTAVSALEFPSDSFPSRWSTRSRRFVIVNQVPTCARYPRREQRF